MTSRPGPHSAHAQILGEVIIPWSSVSQCLEQLFTYLADRDDAFVVGVFVEKIRDGQLDEVVSSLAAQAMDDPRDAIRDWVARVKAARKIRNEYLHGVYLPMPTATESNISMCWVDVVSTARTALPRPT